MPPPTAPQLTTLGPLFPEIRLRILSIAARSPEVLLALVSTCRAWHATYMPLLYETVALDCSNGDDLFYGLNYQLGVNVAPASDADEQEGGSGGLNSSGSDGLGEGGDEEVRGRGLDSYWDQTPHSRLLTRLSLVRRLEILDSHAFLSISRPMLIVSRGAHGNLPPPSLPLETFLLPSCRSVILHEDVLTVVDTDSPRRFLLNQVFLQDGVVLAGAACVDVELHFPKERLENPSAFRGFLRGIGREMGMTVTLHNILAEQMYFFSVDHLLYKMISNLQLPGDEEEFGKEIQEEWLIDLLNAIQNQWQPTL
ncbi:hypothetical protein IAT38_006857 [Cryptococcus sp. DSM 104549]